jgi:hypothetical protein
MSVLSSSSKASSRESSRKTSSHMRNIDQKDQDMSKWQSTLEGGLSFAMSESVLEEGDATLAAERYNVKQKDDELTKNINRLHDQQMAVCEQMKKKANSKGVEIYEKLLFKVRWADPELSLWQQSLIIDYVQHLLGPDPKRIFPGERIMRAMFEKTKGRRAEKAHGEILKLVNRIRSIILYNDGKVADIKSALKEQETKMVVKKAGQLRWLMEANKGRKDRFWTTWYFASHGMAAPLQRHLASLRKKSQEAHLKEHGGGGAGEAGWSQKLARDEDWRKGITPTSKNDVDARDPDFGLTALHYASKTSNLAVVKVLLSFDANPNIRAPDGRTALHFAAAYSTRQVMIELLGHEADINAVDNFGCTPEIMAEQNENRTTWLVLQRWKTLVPAIPSRPATPKAEEFIPEVFQSVSEEVVERMSKPLQAIARRLSPPQSMVTDTQEWLDKKDEDRKRTERQKWLSQGVSEEALNKYAESVRLEEEKVGYGVDPSVELTDEMRVELEAEREREEKAANAKNKALRKGQPMSPIVELRLCQKFAEMCFEENFVDEGLKGLRRRWETSRKLLATEQDRMAKVVKLRAHHNSSRHNQSRSISTSVDDRKNTFIIAKGDVASVGFSTDEGDLDEEPANYHADAKAHSAGYSLHACVECGRELAEALIKYNQEGFAATVLEECLMLTGVPKLASDVGKGEGEGEGKSEDMGKDKARSDRSLTSRVHFLGDADFSQGAFTAEQTLTNLESSTTVGLLARRCEVLLCVWDLLLRDVEETARTRPFPTIVADQYGAHYEEIRKESIASLAEVLSPSKASLIRSLSDAPVDYSVDCASQTVGPRLGGQLDLSMGGSLDQYPSVLTENTGVNGHEQSESLTSEEQKQRARGGHSADEDSSAWYEPDFKLSPTKAYLEKQPVPALPEPSAVTSVAESSVDDQTFIGFGYVGRNFHLYQRILTVAVQCRDSIDLAVDIVTASSSELLVEPYVLVPLLELRAEVYEREEDIENSVQCLMRAENCSKRSVGLYSLETLKVMLELLRVLIKCETPEGMRAATEKATEVGLVLDKMEEIKQKAAAEESRKSMDIYAIIRARAEAKEKKEAEAEAERQREAEEVKSPSFMDAQKFVDLMESGADRQRLGVTQRRGAMTGGHTTDLKQHVAVEDVGDTSLYHLKAMELMSLAKLLDCKMETMPSLSGNPGAASDRVMGRDHTNSKGHSSSRHIRSKASGSPGGSMSHFSVVKSVLGRNEARRKEEERRQHKVAHEAESPTVYTGRARPAEDTSQTLAIPTADTVQQGDGASTKVRKGTRSAKTAPHEHHESLTEEGSRKKGSRITFADESNVPSPPRQDERTAAEDEEKLIARRKAADLAMAGLRASRMLSRPTYYKVPSEPRAKRAFVPVPPPCQEEEKAVETSAAYYKQLQTRSLTHDVTKAARERSAELQQELSSSLRLVPHTSTYLSSQPTGPSLSSPSPFASKVEKIEESQLLPSVETASYFDTTHEEAVLASGNSAAPSPSHSPNASSGLSKEHDALLTEVQRQSLMSQKQEINAALTSPKEVRPSEAELAIRSPYEADPSKIRAGADSISARASYINPGQDRLSSAQRLVMANVHGTVNLGTRHRLERLVKERPALKGLIRDDAHADPPKILVERGALDSTTDGPTDTHIAQREEAMASSGVGSVLHTGTAVISIPHTSQAVAVAPEVLKSVGTKAAAQLVSRAISEEKAAMPSPFLNERSVDSSLAGFEMSVGKLPSTRPRGRDLSSLKYSDKKQDNGQRPAPIVRYRNGEWKVTIQEEYAASQEMLQSTSLASLSKSIAEIEEQREANTVDKSFYL